MSKPSQDHINSALQASKKSTMHKKFGAVLIYNGKIISIGYNKPIGNITDSVNQCLLCGS